LFIVRKHIEILDDFLIVDVFAGIGTILGIELMAVQTPS
jgi:hypothetical protein